MIVKLVAMKFRGEGEFSIALVPTVRIERKKYIAREGRGRVTSYFIQWFIWALGWKVFRFPGRKQPSATNPYQGRRKK